MVIVPAADRTGIVCMLRSPVSSAGSRQQARQFLLDGIPQLCAFDRRDFEPVEQQSFNVHVYSHATFSLRADLRLVERAVFCAKDANPGSSALTSPDGGSVL